MNGNSIACTHILLYNIISFFKMAFINGLKAGNVILPEVKSKDGKLTFKEIIIPEGLDLTIYEPLAKLITNIIALNGNPSMQINAIRDCDNEYDIYTYLYEDYYAGNEFFLLLEYAIWLRAIEFDNKKIGLNIDEATIEKLLLYNGQPITKAEYDAIIAYMCAIDLIKENRFYEKSNHMYKTEVEEMKKYLTPEADNGFLSWILNFIKTRQK